MIEQGHGRRHRLHRVARTRVFAGPNNVAYGAAKADQAHQVRLLAAELGEHGIRVNGVNPDGVVRGSGIFAGGWGAQRAAVYGVPEEELGAFYAQRTLLKREVLPEHVADAVFALTGGDLTAHHRPARPGRRRRRRRVPAMTRCTAADAFAAVDLGASSGRVMVGRVGPDGLELHGGAPVPQPAGAAPAARCTGTCCALYAGILDGLRARPGAGRLDGVGIDSWAVDYGLLDADGGAARQPGALPRRRAPTASSDAGARRWCRPTSSTRRRGLQHLPFNTLFQLAAAARHRPARRRRSGCC